MKFLRLRVTNYRGIDTTEVTFGPTGITLIQGQNESGKTSLREAIGILFEYLDTSRNRVIEAIKPVNRDEGPEVELQAESGQYSFTYYKRFLKKPETKLTISKPKPENLTGREAHERAESILRETLDIDLWKALTIQQGDAIRQPDLTKQTSLSAALDQAAGGSPVDPQDEGLFSLVRNEYLLYYTEKGSERKEIAESRKSQKQLELDVSTIEQEIRKLDQDIDRASVLIKELDQLKKQEDDLTKSLTAYRVTLEEITNLEVALSTARLRLDSAQKSAQVARTDKEVRDGLINSVATGTNEYDQVSESCSMSLTALNQAESDLRTAQKAFDESDKARKLADSLVILRRADYDYFNNKLHLEQLNERKERIDHARQNASQAEALLTRNKVDSRALKLIEEAERALLTASAQLQIGAPSVMLHGLSECRLSIDDSEVTIGKDEVRKISVAEKSCLTLPGLLEVEITAGSSIEGLAQKVDDARQTLEKLCVKYGVLNPDEARSAFEERREALRKVETKAQVEKDNLRDLTYEDLVKKQLGLQTTVPEYLEMRVATPEICVDLHSAKKERTSAEELQKESVGKWESARDSLDSARSLRDGYNAKYQESRVQLELLSKGLDQARSNLERARASIPDDALSTTLSLTARAVIEADGSVCSSESALSAMNPERVKTLAETAKGSLLTTQNRRNAAQSEQIEVQTRLKIHGEEGLYEKLNAAQMRFERVEAINASLFRRASSANYLFQIMRDERDRARHAYVAPLKMKIEQLGRFVFDDTFQVDISDDLQIDSRTVKNVTVPFDSLSGGTKEQLSLIFRSACSMIVAHDGGMPFILDDALGYTDPERLQLMGAVLAKAAKECQIIIFTCVPERYGNVGQATVVSMG